jgi:hypothetical protein
VKVHHMRPEIFAILLTAYLSRPYNFTVSMSVRVYVGRMHFSSRTSAFA